MKTTKIIVIFFVLATLISCKPNDWLDWKTQNEIWLQENAKKEGVKTTSSGLQYKCIVPGIPQSSGNVDDNKIVKINYTGKLINGYKFDSSKGYENFVNAFVPGFVEGLKLMKEFGIYELYIPYELGYGVQGMGSEGTISHIPPFSTLIFTVELLDVY